MRLSRFIAGFGAAALGTNVAYAHSVGSGHDHALHWSFEPWVLIGLAAAAVWYGIGLRRLWQDAGHGRIIAPMQWMSFVGGLLMLVIALVSPIDALSEDLFSVHMVQHLLLLLAAPPLLVLSRPAIVLLWAFPLRARKRIGLAWTWLGLGRGVGFLMRPLIVWILFSFIFVFWHLPGPYAWALRDGPVHVLEHVTFFVSALMFWTIVIEPSGRRRLPYGASLVFVGTTAILSSLPGALIVLAQRPLYPLHAEGAAAWGLTLLQDQQLAGVIMWVPAGLAYIVAVAWLFAKWMEDAERRELRRAARISTMLLLAMVLPALLTACDDREAAQAQARAIGGSPEHGAALIRQFGCGACHTIPGITGADGLVGPPLTHMARRIYVAGMLRNTPDNMIRWLMNPQQIVPGNAMPDMDLTEAQARDVTTYLYTLR